MKATFYNLAIILFSFLVSSALLLLILTIDLNIFIAGLCLLLIVAYVAITINMFLNHRAMDKFEESCRVDSKRFYDHHMAMVLDKKPSQK